MEDTQQQPMGAALDEEVIRLERVIALGGVLMGGVGLLLSLYTALFVSPALGWSLSALAMVLLGWFLVVRWCLKRRMGARFFPYVNPVIEVSMPTALVVIDAVTQGPEYALASSVPMQFYAIFTAIAVMRLKRVMPLVVGIVGAVEYTAAFLVVIRPQMDAALLAHPAFRIDMVLMRSVVIALGGGAVTLASVAIRRAVSNASSEVRSHELFGKYRLGPLLASGGMGAVYRATYCPEGGFERAVAIKRIHPELAVEEHLVEAFRNEAELTARLLHPNIVQVLDFGRIEDTYFLAMDFVDGITLRELGRQCLMRDVHIPPRLVALVGRELCEGLDFAHRRARDAGGRLLRVVHRDLNPPNILLSRTGEVKILDFGVAKALREARASTTKYQVGKAAYMSPEQAKGAPLDERTDLFALGIILWETLCLRPLFARGNDLATFDALLKETAPSVANMRDDVDAARWDALIGRALERDMTKRFQSAEDMRDALDALLEQEGVPRPDELAAFVRTMMDGPRVENVLVP